MTSQQQSPERFEEMAAAQLRLRQATRLVTDTVLSAALSSYEEPPGGFGREGRMRLAIFAALRQYKREQSE